VSVYLIGHGISQRDSEQLGLEESNPKDMADYFDISLGLDLHVSGFNSQFQPIREPTSNSRIRRRGFVPWYGMYKTGCFTLQHPVINLPQRQIYIAKI